MKKLVLLLSYSLLSSSLLAQLPTTGLVAWYPFCGNTNDYSGNNYNLINSGAVLTTDRLGNANCAYQFNGINNIMHRTPPLPTDETNFTYTAWLVYDTLNNAVIVANGNLNIDGYEMLITGYLLLSLGTDVGVIFGGVNQYFPTPVSLHQWHQTVLRRRTSDTYDFIIDTTLIATFTATFNPTSPSEDFAIGMDFSNGTNPFQGKLDDIAVYNRALSDAEITQLYHYNPSIITYSPGNDTTICIGSKTALRIAGSGGIWSSNNSSVATVSGNGVVTGITAGKSVILYATEIGCASSVTTTVTVDSCREIIVHDVITPNGDGINDTWIIEGIENYSTNAVKVFDKWGDLVYEQPNYQNNWDGKGKSGQLPDGTYYYLVKLNTQNAVGSNNNAFTGSLLIKR